MNPKISIITASYKHGRFIEQAILSVKNQTYSPIEHIVMDGGSTDDTVDILRRYEGTYCIRWRSQPDRGQSHAYNKAIEIATGEWINFLNSDDYLLDNNSIIRVVKYIRCHPGFSIFMGKIWTVDDGGCVLQNNEAPFVHSVYTHDILLNEDAAVVHQATFYHRRVFERVGGYSERFRYHMDYEFHLRASNCFDIRAMELPVAALRGHPSAKHCKSDSHRYTEMFWARRSNGGKLIHQHNLYFLKGFIASHPWTKPLYDSLKRLSLLQRIAIKMGWNRLGLGSQGKPKKKSIL